MTAVQNDLSMARVALRGQDWEKTTGVLLSASKALKTRLREQLGHPAQGQTNISSVPGSTATTITTKVSRPAHITDVAAPAA